jgi:hypothetical protein
MQYARPFQSVKKVAGLPHLTRYSPRGWNQFDDDALLLRQL